MPLAAAAAPQSPPAEEEEVATGAATAAAAPPAFGGPPSSPASPSDSKPDPDELSGNAATGGDGGLGKPTTSSSPPPSPPPLATGALPVVLRVDVATQLQAQILSWSVIILNTAIAGVALAVILWRSNRKGTSAKTPVGQVWVGRVGLRGADAMRSPEMSSLHCAVCLK